MRPGLFVSYLDVTQQLPHTSGAGARGGRHELLSIEVVDNACFPHFTMQHRRTVTRLGDSLERGAAVLAAASSRGSLAHINEGGHAR